MADPQDEPKPETGNAADRPVHVSPAGSDAMAQPITPLEAWFLVFYFLALAVSLTALASRFWSQIPNGAARLVISVGAMDAPQPGPPTLRDEAARPGAAQNKTQEGADKARFPDVSLAFLLVLAGLAGAMGGLLDALISFSRRFSGEAVLRRKALAYVLRPFSGSIMAMILLFLVMGGLASFDKTASDTLKTLDPSNVMLYLGVASIAGMFTGKAWIWLRRLAHAFFGLPGQDDAYDDLEKEAGRQPDKPLQPAPGQPGS